MNQDQLRAQVNRLEELAMLLFEQQFIRHGGRKPADPEWEDDSVDREEWRDRARDVAPLLADRDEQVTYLKWLHAEARHDLAQAYAEAVRVQRWANEVTDQWERHHQNDVLPYTAKLEAEVAALKAAIADIDAHATPVGLLHNDDPEGSPHHYLLTVGALHRALGKAYTAEPCERERTRLRAELERSEASRRGWATEALDHDMAAEYQALGTLDDQWPEEPGPNAPCACLTPEGAAQVAAQPKWTLPQCCVHPDRPETLFERKRESVQSGPQTAPYPTELWSHGCPCLACVPADAHPFSFVAQMHLCPHCGNKRCPGAANHDNTCSGSNEPGQPGSLYVHPDRGGQP